MHQKFFIKFSKKLNSIFFYIINARHLQMRVFRDLDKKGREVFAPLFKKLDELENKFTYEY